MNEVLYFAAWFVAHLANNGWAKTLRGRYRHLLDEQQIALVDIVKPLGSVNAITIFTLFIGGFFVFTWWIPFVGLVTMALIQPLFFRPAYAPSYCIFGTPAAIVLTVVVFVLAVV